MVDFPTDIQEYGLSGIAAAALGAVFWLSKRISWATKSDVARLHRRLDDQSETIAALMAQIAELRGELRGALRPKS